MWPAICSSRAWPSISSSTARPPAASASRPATVDNVLYDAFGQRIVSTIYTQSNQYRVILEVDPTLQQIADRADLALSAVIVVVDQRPGAADGHRAYRAARRAAVDHPFRPVSGDDDLVQYRAGLFARCRHHGDPASRGRGRPAAELHHRISRHRGGIPVVADQRDVPDHRRGGGDVYRARRSLRELHPSDHDPVDLAVGGRRRAACR